MGFYMRKFYRAVFLEIKFLGAQKLIFLAPLTILARIKFKTKGFIIQQQIMNGRLGHFFRLDCLCKTLLLNFEIMTCCPFKASAIFY